MAEKNFEYFTDKIARKYKELPELEWGWRFIYGPKETFYRNNRILIIGLNPGGGQNETRKDTLPTFEKGNAYIFEEWGDAPGNHPLQKQMLLLFKSVARKTNTSHFELINNSFTSNIIPFRSPNFEKLPYKKELISFSTNLWAELLEVLSPKLIISVGNSPSCSAYSILKGIYSRKGYAVKEKSLSINWGNYKTYISDLKKGSDKILMIGLPHLTRFKFIGRSQSRKATETIEDIIADNI